MRSLRLLMLTGLSLALAACAIEVPHDKSEYIGRWKHADMSPWITALWPGGQIVSDEALTQVIFRARAVLGRYAVHLLTVRGVGLRIDSEVRVLEAITVGRLLPALGAGVTPQRRASHAAPTAPIAIATSTPGAASAAGTPSAASVLQTSAKRSPPWLWLGVIAVPISAIATISVIRRQVSTQKLLVDEGYGLVEAGLHARQPGTAVEEDWATLCAEMAETMMAAGQARSE